MKIWFASLRQRWARIITNWCSNAVFWDNLYYWACRSLTGWNLLLQGYILILSSDTSYFGNFYLWQGSQSILMWSFLWFPIAGVIWTIDLMMQYRLGIRMPSGLKCVGWIPHQTKQKGQTGEQKFKFNYQMENKTLSIREIKLNNCLAFKEC